MAEQGHTVKKSASLPDGIETPRRYWAVATLMLALTASVLDATMANVALPTIAHDLGIDPAAVMWVVIAYSLMVVVSLLPLSAVAERIGFRRMFGLGITVFMLSSLFSALSTTLYGLTAGRIAQGLGAAMLMCLFGGLIRNIYPVRKLGFGISLNAMTVGFMSVLGPSIGAFILEFASWRWIFAINIPFCLLAYFGIRFLPDVPRNIVRFDWFACALSVLVFGFSVIGLDSLAVAPLSGLACIAVAVVAALVLVRHSRGQTAPIVPIDLLRITTVAFAIAASVFSFAAQMSAFVALPFYFQKILGLGYVDIGILLGVWSLGVVIMAPIAGYMADKFPVAILCGLGALGMALGLLWVIMLPLTAHLYWLMGAMLLAGVGFGFFQTPNNRAILGGAPRKRSGAAGALQATTRVFGQSAGTALVALAFTVSSVNGAMFGIIVAVSCSLAAVVINVVRYYSPAPDLEI
ncbi:MAG TPA: MFS transporter [Eoetvoesiella sp.]